MSKINQLGIYKDHSTSKFLAISNVELIPETINSRINNQVKRRFLSGNEALIHYKEQQKLNAFYKRIGLELIKYNEVVLFGTNESKNELFNILQIDHNYDEIKIDIVNTDHLSDQQVNAFVMNYFSETAYSL